MKEFDMFPGKMVGWALDLPRAVNTRPLWARLLFWLALGKAGRHEFWGLVWAISRCRFNPWYPECEWRTDSINKMPLFWLGKEPVEYEESGQ